MLFCIYTNVNYNQSLYMFELYIERYKIKGKICIPIVRYYNYKFNIPVFIKDGLYQIEGSG